jgi:hypothetical protein
MEILTHGNQPRVGERAAPQFFVALVFAVLVFVVQVLSVPLKNRAARHRYKPLFCVPILRPRRVPLENSQARWLYVQKSLGTAPHFGCPFRSPYGMIAP